MSDEQYLLVINTPPALEDSVSDWLLQEDACEGFTSSAVHGHSRNTHHYSLAEQVTGRQKRTAFQIQGEAAQVQAILQGLRQQFQGVGLHYWIVPVLEGGEL
ncbi:MAG TPA: DUF3240 domain-containing protein [Gammaproteobacteria bacterium]|nr:DUF3240 domain-containing protein [Gammaproteobacteria bacterium]